MAKKTSASGASTESKTKEKKAKQEASKDESLPEYTWKMGDGTKKRK